MEETLTRGVGGSYVFYEEQFIWPAAEIRITNLVIRVECLLFTGQSSRNSVEQLLDIRFDLNQNKGQLEHSRRFVVD